MTSTDAAPHELAAAPPAPSGEADAPAGAGAPPGAARRARARGRSRRRERAGMADGRLLSLAAACYLALACLAFWPVPPFSDTHVVFGGNYDVAEQTWFLAWTPHALAHGLNPFFSAAENVPFGVNLASNTSMPLLGLLAAPVTVALGPFAAFNVMIRLGLAASALATLVLLRRLGVRPRLSFAGGLAYGFSPYLLAQASLHLNLSFLPVPPLVLAVLDELLRRRRRSARALGLLLGALGAAQFLISSEVLADLVAVIAVGLVAVAIHHPRAAQLAWRRVAGAAAWAVVPFALCCAYPIAYGLLGPQHVTANTAVVRGNGSFRADLLSPLLPTSHLLLAPASWTATADRFVAGNLAESGLYLGVPAVLVIALGATLSRRPLTRLSAGMALAALVLSLGPRLAVDTHTYAGVPLPFALLQRLPVLDFEVPARYGAFTALFAVVALALLGEEALAAAALAGGRSRRGRATVAVLGALCLVPLLPRLPERSHVTGVPRFFRTADVERVPAGSVALTYPYPVRQYNRAMAWQAEARFRFSILGGYSETPFPQGRAATGDGTLPAPLQPGIVQSLFSDGISGPPPGRRFPARTAANLAALDTFLRRYHVQTVFVQPMGARPHLVVVFLTDALHVGPRRIGGVAVWFDVPALVRLR